MKRESKRERAPEFRAGDPRTVELGRLGGLRSGESRRLRDGADPRTRGLLGHLLTLSSDAWMDRLGLTGPSWDAWRVVGRVLDGMPLSTEDLATYRALTGRERVPAAAGLSELWALAGRGSGKTTFGAMQAVKAACRGYADVRGVPRVLLLAFVREQAGVAFEYVEEFFDGDRELRKLVSQRTKSSLTLAHGVQVQTTRSHYRSVRAPNVAFALADELAYWWSDESNANPALEVLRGLRPALGKVPGSRLLALTTPWTQEGVVYDTVQRYHGADDSAHVLVIRAPTLTLNPSFDRARIEVAEALDPESAASEYNVAWRVAGGTLVRPDAYDACVDQGVTERPPEPPLGDDWYTAAADLAGGTGEDSATLTVCHEEEGEDDTRLAVQDALREWAAPFDPSAMVAGMAEVLGAYGVTRVVGDQFSEGFAAAEFRRHGIRYTVSGRKTSECVLDSLAVLNTRRARLLDLPRARRQWLNLRRDYASGGRPTIADTRRRDDLAVVTARGIVALLGLGEQPKKRRKVRFI